MCGRVFVKSSVDQLLANFSFAARRQGDGLDDFKPIYNGAPSLEYPIIVYEPDFPGGMFMRARWGLIPWWVKGKMKHGRRSMRARKRSGQSRCSATPIRRDAH